MLNHSPIMGRLVADPELRTTQNGIPVTSFRIAVERNYAGQDGERETDFFDVTAWRGTAEIVCEYFAKGRMIAIDGRLETQAWTDRLASLRRASTLPTVSGRTASPKARAAAPGAGAVRQRESMGGASASPIIFLLRRSAAELHMSSPSPVFVRGGCNLLIARAERRAQK